MKKYLIICLLTFLYSCSVEESCEQFPTLTTEEANNITDKSVTLVGKIIPPTCDKNITSQGFVYSKTELPKVDDNLIEKSGTNISAELENLEQNTTYYVRTFFENTEGVFYGNEIEFRTNIGDVLLSINNISNVRTESFNVSLYINSLGGGTILKKGICYSTTDNPTINDSKLELNSENNNLSGTIDNLIFNTVYYLRGYVENENGFFYSEGLNVTTKDGVISLSTTSVGNITTNSINVSGNISDDGGSTITLRGFCWNKTGNPTIDDDNNQNGDDIGEFSSLVNGLESNKRYYVKTYAQNSIGVFYGNEIEFKTKSVSDIIGRWVLLHEAGALAVGPNLGNVTSWWSNDLAFVKTRECLFDDVYEFNADQSFNNIVGDATWLEGTWESVPEETCGTALAPFDGSNKNATWSHDPEAGTVTLNGAGAFLGISKVHNTGELTDPAGVKESITYSGVTFSEDKNYMTLHIQYDPAGNTWQFKFAREGSDGAN